MCAQVAVYSIHRLWACPTGSTLLMIELTHCRAVLLCSFYIPWRAPSRSTLSGRSVAGCRWAPLLYPDQTGLVYHCACATFSIHKVIGLILSMYIMLTLVQSTALILKNEGGGRQSSFKDTLHAALNVLTMHTITTDIQHSRRAHLVVIWQTKPHEVYILLW